MTNLDLHGVPWFLGQVILKTIANPKCSPDAVLLLADAMEECARELPAQTVYRIPCDRVISQLRTLAPSFDKSVELDEDPDHESPTP